MSRTVSWKDFEAAEPEFAGRVRAVFESRRHKTIATLRADGSPRISGIETEFADGELRFGSMTGARKGSDLRRDPRFALHSASDDPAEGDERSWPGDAKVAGRAVPAGAVTNGPEGELFHADLTEVVLTHLDDLATKMIIETWSPTRGLRQIERV